jgi:2-haloacid dehalogenase
VLEPKSGSLNRGNHFGIKALTVDVYGTVVDWRRTIAREGAILVAREEGIDWAAVADAWRRLYQPTIDRVASGELAWSPFDDLQRLMLDQVLDDFGIVRLTEAEKTQLSQMWAHMDAWPDAVPGLARLKRRYIVCALSNGSVHQLVNIAKGAGLPWDLIISVEMFHAYKPDPRVYLGALGLLQCRPDEVMMVATHAYDLRAAASQGLRTAFVARPFEWGPQRIAERGEPGEFNIVAEDLEDLASQLGC